MSAFDTGVIGARREMVECELVGEGMADIVGIGIMVGFVGQALLSLLLSIWVFFLSRHSNLDTRYAKGTLEHKIERKRLGFASDLLMIGNDIQMVLGASYMINAFIIVDHLDLYHLHLVFDIVSFVGVSNAAAMVCWTFCKVKLDDGTDKPQSSAHISPGIAYFTPRHRATYGFAVMFLALTVLLCVQLSEWAPNQEPGRCYHAQLITLTHANHPAADITYVVVTAVWMIFAMASAILLNAHRRKWVLLSSFLQFPLHLYMALALRSANQGRLEGEESDENGWDFGQTTAVVLLALALGELYRKGREYIQFERLARRNGIKGGSVSVERPMSPDMELEELRHHSYDESVHEERRYLNPGAK